MYQSTVHDLEQSDQVLTLHISQAQRRLWQRSGGLAVLRAHGGCLCLSVSVSVCGLVCAGGYWVYRYTPLPAVVFSPKDDSLISHLLTLARRSL